MPEPPAWMESLVDVVMDCMESHGLAGPLGFRWGEEDGLWDLMVYLTPGELVGGADDGCLVSPGFSLHVHELTAAFEEVVAVHWQAKAFGPHDTVGPCLSIEGVYEGHSVYLEVLGDAPEDEEPGFRVDFRGRSREE